MTAPPPRRPWWKRKRTWAAVALWLVFVAYPLSIGPAYYASNRGLIPHGSHLGMHGPVWQIAIRLRGGERLLKRYVTWWALLGQRHAASD